MDKTLKIMTPKCGVCGKHSIVEVNQKAYENWRNGELIQIAFPDMDYRERELLISGTHDKCWKKMFAEEA